MRTLALMVAAFAYHFGGQDRRRKNEYRCPGPPGFSWITPRTSRTTPTELQLVF